MWYQSPLIGPMGQGPLELQSVAAAQFLVPPGFGPTRTAVLDNGSPQPTDTYTGFSLYSHSYTPHVPPPRYYPPPPQPVLQCPQFNTQMSILADSSHFVSQIHSPTPNTYTQFTSTPISPNIQPSFTTTTQTPEFSLPPPRSPDPRQWQMKLQIHKEETSARFSELMTAFTVEQEEFRRELREELRQLRLSYGAPSLPQPYSNPPTTTVSASPLLSSSSFAGNPSSPSYCQLPEPPLIPNCKPQPQIPYPKPPANFTLPQAVANPTHTQIVNATPPQFLPQIHHSPNVKPHKMKLKFGQVHQKVRIQSLVTLKRKLRLKFSHQKQSQTSGDSKTTWVDHPVKYRLCKSQKQFFGRYYHRDYGPVKFVSEIGISKKCGSVSSIILCFALVYEWSRSGRKLILKQKCANWDYNEAFEIMLREKFDKAFRENGESISPVLVQFDRKGSDFLWGLLVRGYKRTDENLVRLQLQGLFNEGLHKSVLVPTGDMNSMDFFFEVFLSLPYSYHNWRARLDWFLATVIQCSVDPYLFIGNTLLGDIGGRVSLHFSSMMKRKTRNVEKLFDVIWQRWKSQIISGTLIIEIFVKELNVEFFGNYMKSAWILLDIYHTSIFRNCLLLLTAPAKDVHVLQEFKGVHFYWVPEVIQSALFLYLNLQEFVSFSLLHKELIYGGHQVTECQLEILSNVTYDITVRYKRLLQFLSQYLRLLALICGLYDETIEISLEFSKTSEPGMVIHTRGLLTTRRYQAIVSLQLGYSLRKGLLFLCIAVVGKVSRMLIQLGSKKLDDNIGWTYWQKQVDHDRDVIGNSRGQFNNTNCGVKWVGVIHIFNQPSSYSLEVIGILRTAFELSHWRYENITWFLLLNLCMWLRQSLQIIIHNETTSATLLWFLVVNCDSRFLVVNCDSLPEQRHNYLKITCDLEGMIDWKWWQGYQVVLGIGIAGFGLYNFSINKQLPQYRSLKIIQRTFSLEALRVYSSHSGKVPTDNSYLLWPFVLVTKLALEERALTVALQTNEQLTKIKTKSSVGMNMARPGNKMHDYSRAALEITFEMRNYSLQGRIYMVKSLEDLHTVNEVAGFWLQVTKALSSFKQERILPIHDVIVCGVEATIGDTFLEGEQQVWFAVLAICWSSTMILKLEVKFQLKRGGDVRTPILSVARRRRLVP